MNNFFYSIKNLTLLFIGQILKFFFYFLISLLLFLLSCNKDTGEPEKFLELPNSITTYIDGSKNNQLDLLERKEKLQVAYKLISNIKEDSLKKPYYLDLVYAYYLLPDNAQFLALSNELLELAKATNDSAIIAKCYWRLGNYYSDIQNKNDSAFFYYNKGQEVYNLIGNQFYAARLLNNMAIIQKNIKDYTGSEITTTRAITILKPLKKYKELYSSYNNLGIVFNELGEYDRALYYHTKALENSKKAGLTNQVSVSLNNVGVVYNYQKKYSYAIQNFEYGLDQDSLYHHDPHLYAMLLDNLAYAKFKVNDTSTDLPALFYNALQIRDSLQISSGITISKLHLAEYFLEKNDTLKGIDYARQVKELSLQSNNFKDYLTSLLVLLIADKDSALFHTKEYIKVNDSLQKEERTIRNKFARIRFETDEYISETERLNQSVLRISFISVGVLVFFALLYIIKDQRSRNKYIKQKQYANKEIYNLLLAQQKNFEEGREKEKQHISRELHDGVLGKLFGVRLSLDSLNEEDTPEIKKKRFGYIEEIQKIAEEIRLISHRLNKTPIVEVDFKKVLEELIAKQNRENITFQIRSDDSIKWNGIEDDVKFNIYRIIQEAINNIHKHSEATEAYVHFQKNGNELILKMEDNGKGIDQMQIPKGIGIQNMKTRAKNIGGKLEIISGKTNKSGTMVKLSVKM